MRMKARLEEAETKAAYATSFGQHALVLWAIAFHSGRRWTYRGRRRHEGRGFRPFSEARVSRVTAR